jgi:hypothetical protein
MTDITAGRLPHPEASATGGQQVYEFGLSHPESASGTDLQGRPPSVTVETFDHRGRVEPVPVTGDAIGAAGHYYGPAGELP